MNIINKRRALSSIVLASTVMGTVPVHAADFKSYDGEIEVAVAYKDKKFFIDGEVQGKDEGAYYFNGSSYKSIDDDDVDSPANGVPYGQKYVKFDTDSFLDLSSGSVSDDSIQSDSLDDAKSNLRKSIKKVNDGRYESTAESSDSILTEIRSVKFNKTWYQGAINSDSPSTKDNGGATAYTVYTDGEGNFIDVDYNLGKVYGYTTTGSAVNLKNTKDEDSNVRASIRDDGVIASDSNYIYRKAILRYFDNNNNNITDQMKFTSSKVTLKDSNGTPYVAIPVIQKISKTKGSTAVDGAYTPSTVETYFVTEDDGKPIDITGNFTVVDGKLVVYKYTAGSSITAKTLTPKSKSSYIYFDVEDADLTLTSGSAVDLDVSGNLWVLNKGKVYKYNNDDEFEQKYKVDGSEDKLSVYDSNNILAWSSSSDVYDILGGASATANDDDKDGDAEDSSTGSGSGTTTGGTGNTATSGTTGSATASPWSKDEKGKWHYKGATQNGWIKDRENWYYIDSLGLMQTGWVNDRGTWYYMDMTGVMKTGWVSYGGNWYHLGESGDMSTGWKKIDGAWYYMLSSGAMARNTTIDGYHLGPNGAWIK